MRNLSENDVTEAVLGKLAGSQNPRLAQLLGGLVRHLHDFVREAALTEAEWMTGIEFLTATGQKCDDKRQEFILLSDTLGISMLVDAIANRKPSGATETTVLGPFYRPGADLLPMWSNIVPASGAPPAFLSGRVVDLEGEPIAGAILDVWQTDDEGLYDVQRMGGGGAATYGRGRFETDSDGRYGFRTVRPVSYSIPTDGPVGVLLRATGRSSMRPAHIHMIVDAPGFAPVTTHLFVAGDPYLDSDAVFAVKQSLVIDFTSQPPGQAPDGRDSPLTFCTATFDFKLVRCVP